MAEAGTSEHAGSDRVRGYASLYLHIAKWPHLGRFRKHTSYWAKRLHDETWELRDSLLALNHEIENRPELEANNVLECPLSLARERYPRLNNESLYAAWDRYDLALMKYGQTLSLSQQVINLPTQHEHYWKNLLTFKEPKCDNIFEHGLFMPTGEDEEYYTKDPGHPDMCAWVTILHSDFFTSKFISLGPWLVEKVLPRRLGRFFGKEEAQDGGTAGAMRYGAIESFMDMVTCVLASGLLIVPVVVLAYVRSFKARIGVIAGFGTLFALLLKLIAGRPGRAEVFMATGAFYAVAVVFVGSIHNECTCM